MKKVAVLISDQDKLYEGLRSSLGLSLVDHQVSMFVLGHEIPMDEAYLENMGFLDEMGGLRYSDVPVNAEQHGFHYISPDELSQKLLEYEVLIPF
ncbi:MAG: hypothetical protein JRI22_09860 [Deltaproteobacteria bacterium]|nr:hypothetical protein [Deltaproteobacteria bacterium]